MLPVPCVSITATNNSTLPVITPLWIDTIVEESLLPDNRLATLDEVITHLEYVVAKRKCTLVLHLEDLIVVLKELNGLDGLTTVKSQIAKHVIYMIHNMRTYLRTVPHTIIMGPATAPKHLLAAYLGRIRRCMGLKE